jgi:hypothetical protein
VPDEVKSQREGEERRWLGEMEHLGYAIIAARFASRMAVTDRPPYPEADFVRAWLREQERAALREKERAANRRLAWQTSIAVITMIAACVAAWPVVKDWIR